MKDALAKFSKINATCRDCCPSKLAHFKLIIFFAYVM